MHMRTTAVCISAFLGLSVGALSQAPVAQSAGYAKIRLIRVGAPPLDKAETTQFLAANAKGHPLLLRGDTFEVFSQGADGEFDHRHGVLACDHFDAPAYAAAMDPVSQTWVVGSMQEVALCDFSRQERPQGLHWTVSSLAYGASGPLVGVTSLGPRPDAAADRFQKTIPRVFGITDGRWQPIAWAPVERLKELPPNPIEILLQGKASSDALLCSGPKSALWTAAWNSYRLQKLSSSAKPDREIVVGTGEVEWQKLDAKEQAQEARVSAAQGANGALPPSAAGVPRGVVRALVCSRDGDLYLVVSTSEGLALDRFNPSQNLLERVMLEGATVSSGPMTAVLTGDQLWLGGRLAADGLWRIPTETLANAHWKPVKNAFADGKPLS